MSDDNKYRDADIVWVKLRSCWWPGEVCSHQRQPEGLLKHTKRKPYCVVKFFQEESFEYVKNSNMIYPFNCSKKDEFIRKGHALLAKNKYMEQFPAAVSTAERLTRSVTRSSLFFNSRPDSIIKAILTESPTQSDRIRNGRRCEIVEKILNTTPPGISEPKISCDSSPTYKCSICDFQSTRQNVMVLHRRSHSSSQTTPNRNCSVSNSSNTKQRQKSTEVIEESVKPLKAAVKQVIEPPPLRKQIVLSVTNKTEDVIQTDVALTRLNTALKTSLGEEGSQKEHGDATSTMNIRPPPKKQLSFITCKSESIQKSLLADWIDEDKEEDEDESREISVNETQDIFIVNKDCPNSSVTFASSSASIQNNKNQETVDNQTLVALMEPQKTTSKIRNIPKKDRRNIVFTEFNLSSNLPHADSSSQETPHDACSHFNLTGQTESSIAEPYSIKIPLITKANVIPPVEERHSSKTFTKGQIEKLPDGESHIPIPSMKGKLSVSCYEEDFTCVQPRVQPTDSVMKIGEEERTNTTQQVLNNIEETTTLKPVGDKASVEATSLKSTIKHRKNDLTEVSTTAVKQNVSELFTYDPEEQNVIVKKLVKPTTKDSTIFEINVLEIIKPTCLQTPGLEPTQEKQIESESNIEKTTSIGINAFQITPIQPNTLKLSLERNSDLTIANPTTVFSTSVGPTIIDLFGKERLNVKQTTINTTTSVANNILQSEELDIVETALEKVRSEKSLTVEPSRMEYTKLHSPSEEASTKEPLIFKPSKIESNEKVHAIVEANAKLLIRAQIASTEFTTEEPSAISVALTTFETTAIEHTGIKPHAQEGTANEHATIGPVTVEPALQISTKDSIIVKPPAIEPNLMEPSSVEHNIVKPTIFESTAEESLTVEMNTVELFAGKSSIFYHKPIELNKEILLTSDLVNEPSTVKFQSFESNFITKSQETLSSLGSNAGEQETKETNDSRPELIDFQTKEIEPKQPDDTTSLKTCRSGFSTLELFPNEKPAFSKKPLRRKVPTKKSASKILQAQSLLSGKTKKLTAKHTNKISQILKKTSSIFRKQNLKANQTFSNKKENSNLKKISQNIAITKKNDALRLSMRRGCTNLALKGKEISPKKKNKNYTEKRKMATFKHLSEKKKTDVSYIGNEKVEILTIKEASKSSIEDVINNQLTINQSPLFEQKEKIEYANVNETKAEEQSTNISNTIQEVTSSQIAFKKEGAICPLSSTESQSEISSNTDPCQTLKQDKLECNAFSFTKKSEKSEVISSCSETKVTKLVQSTESILNVPAHSVLAATKQVPELSNYQPRNSFSKASLACFDFNEEEDILTSIANFKKTYVSPEKSYNFVVDNELKKPDAHKLELELKDKILSADIESLLKSTALPLSLSSSAVSNRPLPKEVRGLPIKERGKRIFKSRNRFPVESCTSVSTTSAKEMTTSNSCVFSPKYNELDTSLSVEKTLGVRKQDNMSKKIEKKSMNDNETIEEEIIGRITYSPAEVYAPLNDQRLRECDQIREKHIASSNVKTNVKPLSKSNENEEKVFKRDELTNEAINKGDLSTDQTETDPIVSCDEANNEPKHNLTTPKILDDKNEELVQEVKGKCSNYDDQKSTMTYDNPSTTNSPNVDDKSRCKMEEKQEAVEDNNIAYSEDDYQIPYEKELCTDEPNERTNDSNCDLQFEYELVTTEVSTVVDLIPNAESILENVKESSSEVSEEVVSCCDDGTFLNEMIIADITELQGAITENDIDNSNVNLKYMRPESCVVENNATYESNSCSINATNIQTYSNEENQQGEISPVEVDHAETCSEDSSTIISDAEAEFGSPTSMLDEERVLNRVRLETETAALCADGKGHKTLKTSNRRTRHQLENALKESKILIQSVQCDTQESESNDSVSKLVYDENKLKECLTEPETFCVQKDMDSTQCHEEDVIEKESKSNKNNDLLNKITHTSEIEKDCNFEDSDSSSEEEEEICSPPIEPLVDDDTEAETTENCSSAVTAYQLFHTDNESNDCEPKNKSQAEKECNPELDEKQNQSFYIITKKSDTIIKLNKHKENSNIENTVKGWTETSLDVRKSELAGEELSAAEALLLIPNQPTKQSIDSFKSKKPTESLSVDEKSPALLTEEEIKEESVDITEKFLRTDLQETTKKDIPKEFIRRKRRSHMKVTPRKRVVTEVKLEDDFDESHVEAKIAKLINVKKKCNTESMEFENSDVQKTTFAEQYEQNFVQRYMKEQLIEDIHSAETSRSNIADSEKSANPTEKQTLEKVHITVDISNPLSSQIATILGTSRPSSTEIPLNSGVKKRKQTLEDDIPSFIIKRPCPKTIAEEEAADRKTIAQIQNLCPQVEITRKASKDDQATLTALSQQSIIKPQIINQQIIRSGNNQPTITVTSKSKKPDEAIFDISNMPIVLSNEKIFNEKVHLVITPTTNQQIIKQFQSQQSLLSNAANAVGDFSGNIAPTASSAELPIRKTSCVRTKRTPSRQQLPDLQQVQDSQHFEQENYQEQPDLQQEYVHQHQHLQQQHHHRMQQQQQQELSQLQQQEEPNQVHQQQQNQQLQLQTQNQLEQHHQLQQQLENNHQNQIQNLHEEQNILMQQHHQLFLQEQIHLQQHQQQLQNQQQLITNENVSESNLSEKQIGIDNRGNKYVIIRNPSNSVLMANSSEAYKVQQQRVSVSTESNDQNSQRKQKKKKHSAHTVQKAVPFKSSLSVTSHSANILPVTTTQTNQPLQYIKEQNIASLSIPATTTKTKGRGRGRPPKNKTESVALIKQNTIKSNTNRKLSSGRICEPFCQRPTQSMVMTTPPECQQSTKTSTTEYKSNIQETQSVGFMINPHFSSMSLSSSPTARVISDSYQVQALGQSQQSRPQPKQGIAIETSEVSGGGYAVPSLPVPGYPQTYLLCELIGSKYKEVYSKPLYLSPDRTKFLEVPEELVTEAHKKLSDSRREPNPNALKLMSEGMPQILQTKSIDVSSENVVNQNKQNEVLMQKQLSVEEQATALLCLQKQIVQEQLTQKHLAHKHISQEQLVQEQLVQDQLVQDQLVQDQLVQDQLVQEQFVEEQFVQEQFVHEQFVPEQFVQEQFVQEQFVQGQFVQEPFVQEHFVQEQFVQEQYNLHSQQFTLQLARYETGEAIEDAERGQMMVMNTGTHSMILDDKSFYEFTGEKRIDFYNAEKDTYVLTPQVISRLLHHYALGHITAVPAFNTEIGDQNEVSIADVIQNADSSTNILEVALDDSGLYSEEQFINSDGILQIETPEGMQLIGAGPENADLIFHHMTKASTSETNVLLNQAPKMSVVEVPSDKSKQRFHTKPSTPATLEDCLNVIGVPIQSPTVPTSLELPASVTNPAIVAKTRTPTPGTITMNEIIATGLCHHPDITSLPTMGPNDQELSYEFFPPRTEEHDDKDQVNEESVVTDMGEYAVVSSSGSFDDPGR